MIVRQMFIWITSLLASCFYLYNRLMERKTK